MYGSRKMESEKDDFNIFVGDKYILIKRETTLSLQDRRIELSQYSQNENGRTTGIRDAKGENQQTIAKPIMLNGRKNGEVVHLDWTDNRKEPR